MTLSASQNRRKRKSIVKSFARDEKGATAIEYGLIASLLTVALVGSLGATGDSMEDAWASMTAKIGATLEREE